LTPRQSVFAAMCAGLGVALMAFALRHGQAAVSRTSLEHLGRRPAAPTAATVAMTPAPAWPTPAPALRLARHSSSAAPARPGPTRHPNPPPAAPDADLVPIRQVTFDGCCPGAWWAADSSALHFIDRPNGRLGVYGVPLRPPGSLPRMVDTALDLRDGGTRLVVHPAAEHSVVKDVESGLEWPLPTGGNPVRLAPDGTRAVWWEAPAGRAQVELLGKVYASGIDGAGAQAIGGLFDVDVVGFLADNVQVAVVGRPVRDDPAYILAALDTRTGALRELARGNWLSDVVLSRGRAWAAYVVSLDRRNPDANGVWVVPTDPSTGGPRKLDRFGGYRWRDDQRLVVVPMEPGSASHSIWQFDAAAGSTTRLVDPAAVPIRVANNDWSVSPDGHHLAFVAEDDRNIWVVELP